MPMKMLFAFLAIAMSISFNADCQTQSALPFSVPSRQLTLHSNHLGEDRVLNIYLPLGYDTLTKQNFDVIYLLDGSIDEDFIHVCGAVQFLSFSWINQCQPTIVVGIENVDRRRDFTFPTSVEEDRKTWPTTGHSASFISFLDDELQPFIDSQFRTSNRKILIGQSLGGLLACQIYLEQNAMFTDYIIISPSLWWDNESLIKRYKALPKTNAELNASMQIAVGREGRIMVGDARKLDRLIKQRRKRRYHSKMLYFRACDHGDVGHLAVYAMLKELNLRSQRRAKF
ncbi:MAG: hypothetical protein RLZZ262_475 [Bacteroidota bacterium]